MWNWIITTAAAYFTSNKSKMGSAEWWCGENSLFGCPDWLYPNSEAQQSNSNQQMITLAVAGLAIFVILKD